LNARSAPPQTWDDYRREEARQLLAGNKSLQDWILLSESSNGFVREVAVRTLSLSKNPDALPALIDRLNDWVPQVRDLATSGVQHYLRAEQAQALLSALDHFIALANKGRNDHSETLAAVHIALSQAQACPATLEAFKSQTSKPARFLFALLLEAGCVDQVALIELGIDHHEISVQRLALQATRGLPKELAQGLLRKGLEKRSTGLRLAALRAWLTVVDTNELVHPELASALFDSSASLRYLARWAAPAWQFDCNQVLLQRLEKKPPSTSREWIGLIGLARELKQQCASSMLQSALTHPSPRVRAQALESLTQLNGENMLPQLFVALEDSSERVFACAMALLAEQPHACIDSPLSTLLDSGSTHLSDDRLRALMSLKPSWQELDSLLRAMERSVGSRGFWLAEVRRWCATRYGTSDYHTTTSTRGRLLIKLEDLEIAGELPRGTTSSLR
jgi:HEAT repeat protein